MNRSVVFLLLAACGASHGRVDPNSDAGVDSGSSDSRVLPDAIHVVDVGVPQRGCDIEFPASAFVQDRLDQAAALTITRDALRIAGGAPRPAPAPAPGPGQADPAPPGGGQFQLPREPVEDRVGNCGFERISGFAWDGHRCRGIRTTYCDSNNCRSLTSTLQQCRDQHASCAPEICRRTGGQWSEVPLSCAGNSWHNGIPPAVDCFGPTQAQCVCPVNQSPSERGCQASERPLARDEAACFRSGGIVVSDAHTLFTCGRPGGATQGRCYCGETRWFNSELQRCVSCGGDQAPTLCTDTGGVWDTNACGPHTCGVLNPQRCSSGGCNCGALGVFDAELGCVLAPTCRTNACF